MAPMRLINAMASQPAATRSERDESFVIDAEVCTGDSAAHSRGGHSI
jgi:hypothetical protein